MRNNEETNKCVLEFKDKHAFRAWLEKNHDRHPGTDIYIYKKGFYHLGLNYENAMRTALCFGWIDAVTHRHNEQKFRLYFAPRRKDSNWSLSNIIRMRELIDSGEMTKHGLLFFDLSLLEQIDELIEEDLKSKRTPSPIPTYFTKILIEEDAKDLFFSETPSAQKRYLAYILDAKKQETRLRRCYKIAGIIKGEKNNL